MESCRPELLPLPCKFDIYALPIPEKPDNHLLASYASLVGEMLYVCINTAPELSQAMHQLTRFMTKASRAHNHLASLSFITTLKSDSLPLEATSLWRESESTQRSAVVHRGCEDADTSMGPRAPLPGSSPL